MGLGKTIQALALIACVWREKLSSRPALVIAPKSTLPNWDYVSPHSLLCYLLSNCLAASWTHAISKIKKARKDSGMVAVWYLFTVFQIDLYDGLEMIVFELLIW
jgi:hypothetical protein